MRPFAGVLSTIILSLWLPCSVACDVTRAFASSADRYGLDPTLLYAIAKQESGLRINVTNKNKNGSIDRGPMQINSVHDETMKRRFGIEPKDLFNPCTNIDVGAWLLRQCFNEFGSTWNAVGCYHSRTPTISKRYADQVRALYVRIAQEPLRRSSVEPVRPSTQISRCTSPSGCIAYYAAPVEKPRNRIFLIHNEPDS